MTTRSMTVAWAAVGAVALGFLGANAHLVYVAFTSQPGCVPHLRTGDAPAPHAFAAAKSAC